MYCSSKFFEPTVMVLLALAESFLIVVPLSLDGVASLFALPLPLEDLSSLPHAARTRVRASSASSATRPLGVRLIVLGLRSGSCRDGEEGSAGGCLAIHDRQ